MTSLPIFNSPYCFGNPFVFGEILITESVDEIDTSRVTEPFNVSGVKLSNFKYWSRLSVRSIGPPVYSWEI